MILEKTHFLIQWDEKVAALIETRVCVCVCVCVCMYVHVHTGMPSSSVLL